MILSLPLLLACAPTRAETVLVLLPGGSCALRILSEDGLATETATLAAASARLAALSGRLLADAAAMRLGPAREAVPGFGDWAYGWVQSYVTSYRSLGRGVTGLVHALTTEDPTPLAARIAEEMAEPIRAEFRARVLRPALGDGGFAADLVHVGTIMDVAWSHALRASAARLARHPVAPPTAAADGILNLAAAGAVLAPDLAATAPADPMAMLADEGADGGTVFLRSMRPMAARLGAVAIRISEAGSLIAAGGAFGLAVGGIPGTVIGVAGGIGASWGLDWLLNRLDATLNRAGFETQALEALGRAEERLAEGAAAAAAAVLTARVAVLGVREECR